MSEYLAPEHAAKLLALAQWRNGLLLGYFGLIGAIFVARAVRNALERGRRHLITISYPGRTVRVPRGWSVLEASRSFHLPHASMCGGRARCSTCRVRVSAGEKACPPAAPDERKALDRISAPPDVRLACQLRPQGDLSVIPLVRTERPNYRPTAPRRSAEREVVVLYCDFLNRAELAADHMPQDLLYVLTLYIEGLSNAIRAARGMLSYIELDSLCALFGLERDPARAARQALQAAGAIEQVMAELNERLGRQWNCKVTLAVSIHLGRAVVGEIGAFDPPAVIAIGEAVDATNELRKAAAAHGAAFAISQAVYAAAGVDPPPGEEIMVASPTERRQRFRSSCPPPPLPCRPRRRRGWRRARRCSGCGGSERGASGQKLRPWSALCRSSANASVSPRPCGEASRGGGSSKDTDDMPAGRHSSKPGSARASNANTAAALNADKMLGERRAK